MDYTKLTKQKIIEYIKNDVVFFIDLPESLKDDREIVLVAIEKDESSISYASERLKDDKSVVLETVRKEGELLFFASDRLKDDMEIVLEAVIQYGYNLRYASQRLQSDKELLLLLEKESGENYNPRIKKWYEERMEVLTNLREKELMESFIPLNKKSPKKLKF